MSTGTAIEWTDATWNPVVGCEPVSPGCLNCYAATMAHRLEAMGKDGYTPVTVSGRMTRIAERRGGRAVFTGSVRIQSDEVLDAPKRWKKPRRIFVCSMSDLFHHDVPDAFIARVFDVMRSTPQHTYQVLTKRPERMCLFLRGWRPPDNIWLGTSCEDQQRFDERVGHLLNCRGAVRFLSCEPLLGPISFSGMPGFAGGGVFRGRPAPWKSIDWVIVGGESGPRSRACQLEWMQAIVRQCADANPRVACFVKQLGSIALSPQVDPSHLGVGVKWDRLELKDQKGGDPDEWPVDLRVREWPCADQDEQHRGGAAVAAQCT